MNNKIKRFFETGQFTLTYSLMASQCIYWIDFDVNKLLEQTHDWYEDSWTSGPIPNRTHDFTIEIMSNIGDGLFYSVWICDFLGNELRPKSVEAYAKCLLDNPSLSGDDQYRELHLVGVSQEDVHKLLFNEPIFE